MQCSNLQQVAVLSFIKSAAACGTGLYDLLWKKSILKSLKNYLVSQLEVLPPFFARKDSIAFICYIICSKSMLRNILKCYLLTISTAEMKEC